MSIQNSESISLTTRFEPFVEILYIKMNDIEVDEEVINNFWREADEFADLRTMKPLLDRRYYEVDGIGYFEWLSSLDFIVKHAQQDVFLLILSGGYFVDIFLTIGEAHQYANAHYRDHHVTVVARDGNGCLVFSDRDAIPANE